MMLGYGHEVWWKPRRGAKKIKATVYMMMLPKTRPHWPNILKMNKAICGENKNLPWREKTSYVIAVPGKSKPTLYWPDVSQLRLVSTKIY